MAELQVARRVLREYWGYDDFRSGQTRAIESVLARADTLVVMPTGGGKSLCYQVPALVLPGVTLVVSPLISLMKDQVDVLNQLGVPATLINSSLSTAEMSDRLRGLARGEFKLVYVAPERFESASFRRRAAELEVSLLAVDEAHCVSQWGHDFRPSYLRIGDAREELGSPPVVALTATATPDVRRDIQKQLRLRDPEVIVTGFDRRNLTWHVIRASNDSEKDRALLRLLRDPGALPEPAALAEEGGQRPDGGSAVVYASTRKNVDALTALLSGVGIPTVGYHAGIADAARKRIQDAFMTGEVRVVVATNAFGMGIDKPDVRLVAHYNMPGTLEAYYQEGGRAGRDGKPADCVLLHAYADKFTHEFFIDQNHPDREVVEKVMKKLRALADPAGVVSAPPREVARAIGGVRAEGQVTAAVRVLAEHGLASEPGQGSAGRVRLIAKPARISRELNGPDNAAALTFLRRLWKMGGGERLYDGVPLDPPLLARLAGDPRAADDRLRDLHRDGFLEWDPVASDQGWVVVDTRTPLRSLPVDWRRLAQARSRELRKLQKMQGYAYTEDCRRGYVLKYFGDPEAMDECGACDVCLGTAPTREKKGNKPTRGGSPRRSGGSRAPAAERPQAEGPLYEELRRVRLKLAREDGVPAYVVAPDRTLRELAALRPATPDQLLEISGIGPAKLARYGAALLETVQRHGV